MKKSFVILPFFLGMLSCLSIEKYNSHIQSTIPVEKLQQDVDYAKEKLLTKHVDIDWYHSKAVLGTRLDSFKKTIHDSMKPNEFSRELSKVVASFGHGHTYVSSLNPRITKTDKKRYKKSKVPLELLQFKSVDDRLMLEKHYSKDSTLPVYTEVHAVNGHSFQDFYMSYQDFRKGDGYITSMQKHLYGKTFSSYLSLELPLLDSITLDFKIIDSVFTKIVKREYLSKSSHISRGIRKDSILPFLHPGARKKLTKEEKKRLKQQLQHQMDIKNYFAYEKSTNSYLRSLEFPVESDSSIAVLRIKTFTAGHHQKAYSFIFDSIKRLRVQHLILDLRDNGGGYPSDINHLYSFLTIHHTPQMVTSDEVKVNSKTALAQMYFKKPTFFGHTLFLPFVLYNSAEDLLKTNKKKDGYYYNIRSRKEVLKEENKYEGSVYVLINGMSYSATSLLAAALKHEGKAIFVGEETGGDYNGTVAGRTDLYQLPHSKLRLSLGMMTYRPNTSRALKGRGVFPDVAIEMTFEDLIHQRDPQLQWILNDIKTKL